MSVLKAAITAVMSIESYISRCDGKIIEINEILWKLQYQD